MLILAVETTGPLASVALTDGSRTVQLVNDSEYSHLQETVPLVKEIMESEKVAASDLSAVAVSIGPGSFTGVRIGAATVKALAQVWQKPVIAVPTLKSFAYGKEACPRGILICPIFDARRSEVYAAAYGRDSEGMVFEAVSGAAYGIDVFLEKLRAAMDEFGAEKAVFCGDGVKCFREALESFEKPFEFAPERGMFQTAENIARLAAEMYAAGELTDCYRLAPDYMRIPEAERRLKEKQQNADRM